LGTPKDSIEGIPKQYGHSATAAAGLKANLTKLSPTSRANLAQISQLVNGADAKTLSDIDSATGSDNDPESERRTRQCKHSNNILLLASLAWFVSSTLMTMTKTLTFLA
jgi:hypothetical protein